MAVASCPPTVAGDQDISQRTGVVKGVAVVGHYVGEGGCDVVGQDQQLASDAQGSRVNGSQVAGQEAGATAASWQTALARRQEDNKGQRAGNCGGQQLCPKALSKERYGLFFNLISCFISVSKDLVVV